MSQNNINPSLLNKIRSYYFALLREGAKSFGNDEISKSIFTQLDKEPDGTLSKDEVISGIMNLNEIVSNVVGNAKELAESLFPKTENEIMIDNEIQEACDIFLQYAEKNPKDKEIQQYAKKLKEMMQNGKIYSTKIMDYQKGEFNYKDGESEIIINSEYYAKIEDRSTMLLRTLIHELGHVLDNDKWDSIEEEKDVESKARKIVQEITGVEQDLSNESIDEFLAYYRNSGYAENSPGHNGLPKYLDFRIHDEIESVKKRGKKYIIKTKVDENGKYQIIKVTMGQEKDNNGEKYPVFTEFVTIDTVTGKKKTTYKKYNRD